MRIFYYIVLSNKVPVTSLYYESGKIPILEITNLGTAVMIYEHTWVSCSYVGRCYKFGEKN